MFGTWVPTLHVERARLRRVGPAGDLPMTLTVGALSLGHRAVMAARAGAHRHPRDVVRRRRAAPAHAGGEGAAYFPAVLPVRSDGPRHGHGDAAAAAIAMSGVPEQDAGLASGIVNVSCAAGRRDRRPGPGRLRTSPSAMARASPALTGGYHLARAAAGAVGRHRARRASVLWVRPRSGGGSEVAVEV